MICTFPLARLPRESCFTRQCEAVGPSGSPKLLSHSLNSSSLLHVTTAALFLLLLSSFLQVSDLFRNSPFASSSHSPEGESVEMLVAQSCLTQASTLCIPSRQSRRCRYGIHSWPSCLGLYTLTFVFLIIPTFMAASCLSSLCLRRGLNILVCRTLGSCVSKPTMVHSLPVLA